MDCRPREARMRVRRRMVESRMTAGTNLAALMELRIFIPIIKKNSHGGEVGGATWYYQTEPEWSI
jgi:hypothetical protein